MSVRHLGLNGHHRGTGQEAADGDGPVLSGGVFPDDLAIGIFQSELGVGHGLPRHRIHLRERQRTQGIVVKVELLGVVAGVYHHSLAAGVGVDGIAGGTGHLRADQGASDAGEDDLPLLIRCVQTVGGQLAISGVHHPAVRVGDTELCPLNGGLVHTGQFMEDEVPQLLVAKFQGHSLSGFDLRHLRCIVQQVAGLGPGLLHHQARARFDPADGEGPRAVRHELAVAVAHYGAIAGDDHKFHVTERAAVACVHLLDQQTTLGTVAEADVDDLLLLAGEVHGLGWGVDNVVPVTGQLLNDISAPFQPGGREAAVL